MIGKITFNFCQNGQDKSISLEEIEKSLSGKYLPVISVEEAEKFLKKESEIKNGYYFFDIGEKSFPSNIQNFGTIQDREGKEIPLIAGIYYINSLNNDGSNVIVKEYVRQMTNIETKAVYGAVHTDKKTEYFFIKPQTSDKHILRFEKEETILQENSQQKKVIKIKAIYNDETFEYLPEFEKEDLLTLSEKYNTENPFFFADGGVAYQNSVEQVIGNTILNLFSREDFKMELNRTTFFQDLYRIISQGGHSSNTGGTEIVYIP